MRAIRRAGVVIRLRRPSVFAVVLTVVGIAAFIALGIWQLRRADFKQALLQRFAQAAQAPLVAFAQVAEKTSATTFPHARVHGSFHAHRIYILDNRTHGEQVGVDVFVPFTPDNEDRVLLVDLGFLPRQGAQQALPDLPPVPSGETTLHGIYAPPPRSGLKLGGNQLPREAAWPKLVTYLDLHDIGDDLHRTLFSRVLLLDADPASIYLRQWTPDTMPPARHRAYALQWFTFALAALVIFLVMHRKRDEASSRVEND